MTNIEIVETGTVYETYKNDYPVDKRLYILERQVADLQKVVVEMSRKVSF